jgi:hypothetical protein
MEVVREFRRKYLESDYPEFQIAYPAMPRADTVDHGWSKLLEITHKG